MVGWEPGGRESEMSTLCSEREGFSSSYSRLTVEVPLSEEGQQLTLECFEERGAGVSESVTGRARAGRRDGELEEKLTRKGHHTLIRARQSPLEHAQPLPHRESLLALLQPNLPLLRPSVLIHIGMSLELQIVALVVGRRRGQLDQHDRFGRVGDAEIEVAFEGEGVDPAVAVQGEGEMLANDEVDAVS